MIGISPRAHFMPQQQIATSAAISETVPEFPLTVCDLISQMATTDFSLATQPLDFDLQGEVIQNRKNIQIISYIVLALTAPSSECAPTIKTTIFLNGSEFLAGSRILKPYLARIINGLHAEGRTINLDNVIITNLDMSLAGTIDLSGMSAQGAVFKNVTLDYQKMEGADFTGAKFINSSLDQAYMSRANITDATFENVTFEFTEACELTGNQSGILQASSSERVLTKINDIPFMASFMYLNGTVTAMPDCRSYQLPEIYDAVPDKD